MKRITARNIGQIEHESGDAPSGWARFELKRDGAAMQRIKIYGAILLLTAAVAGGVWLVGAEKFLGQMRAGLHLLGMTGFILSAVVVIGLYFVVHEVVHLAAFKISGARGRIFYFINFMMFAFVFTGVIRREGMRMVLVAPFVILLPPLVLSCWFWPGCLTFGALIFHFAMCSVDLTLWWRFRGIPGAELWLTPSRGWSR